MIQRTFLFFCLLLLTTSCGIHSQASQALFLQDFNKAASLYSVEIAQNPNNWQAGIRLGYALYKQEKFAEALPVFLQYVKISKESNGYATFWAGLCVVALEQPTVLYWKSWTPVSKHSYFTMEIMQQFQSLPYGIGKDAAARYKKGMEEAHAKDIRLTDGNKHSGFYSVTDVPDTVYTMPKDYLP